MNGAAGHGKRSRGNNATPGAVTGRGAAGPLVAQTGGDSDPIRAGLKRLYDSVVEEAIPDDFMALLDRIDAARGRVSE
jgi:hypothetical protein